mgnify:CR=1 FL=1|tara:strand:- start:71 stop:559 length:489 start_codon:yes stop_codon:yes gene_type:complete
MKHLRQYIRQILSEEAIRIGLSEPKSDSGNLKGFMDEYESQTRRNPIGMPGERYWYMGEIDGKYCLVITNLYIDKQRNSIHWSSIQLVPPGACEGQGFASKVMDTITSLADKYGVTLRLDVAPFGQESLTDEDLFSWYGRNGFEKVDGYHEVMERIPSGDDA